MTKINSEVFTFVEEPTGTSNSLLLMQRRDVSAALGVSGNNRDLFEQTGYRNPLEQARACQDRAFVSYAGNIAYTRLQEQAEAARIQSLQDKITSDAPEFTRLAEILEGLDRAPRPLPIEVSTSDDAVFAALREDIAGEADNFLLAA